MKVKEEISVTRYRRRETQCSEQSAYEEINLREESTLQYLLEHDNNTNRFMYCSR